MVSRPLSPTRVKPSTLNTSLSTNQPQHTLLHPTPPHLHMMLKKLMSHYCLSNNIFIILLNYLLC